MSHENFIFFKIPFLLHFLKATDLRSTKQKKLSKSVHWFKSYSTFCTRNWSFFPGFQYKGLLRSDGTEKDFFGNKLKKTEIISCIKKKKTHKTIHFYKPLPKSLTSRKKNNKKLRSKIQDGRQNGCRLNEKS